MSERVRRPLELGLVAVAAALAVWAWVHALSPRAQPEVDGDFRAAAAYVKRHAGPRDLVLVRPIWELAGARAFLPLATGVYRRPVPSLWAGRQRIWVATAHGAEPPAALRRALRFVARKDFGSVRIHRFEVGKR